MPTHGPHRDPDAHRRILDATFDLIAERGPNRVTINDIAREAKVGRQTIYRWWPTKVAVVLAALEHRLDTDAPGTGSANTREDLRNQMQRTAYVFASPTGAIIRQLVADSQGDEEVAELFRSRFVAARHERSVATIRAGIDRGELRADLDVDIVIDLLFSPLWLRMLVGHGPLTRASVDGLLDHAWESIVAR
ncbi:MAG: TetR/AcrR family transcriptional regulator [Ilumatobacter sp.]